MYTDLIFDLYGTLVDIHTEESSQVWEKTALFFGYYGAHYTAHSLQQAFEAELRARKAVAGESYACFPDIPFEDIMTMLFCAKGIEENTVSLGVQAAQLFRISSTGYIRLYPYVLEALTALRAKGYRLWLLSNAQAVFTQHELNHLGLTNCFDGVYLSSSFQCRKPDRRFFQVLLSDKNLDPGSCLMIGNDRETDIAGARAAGIDTFYMHTKLTPSHQASADPNAPMEYEGENWEEIAQILLNL